MNRWNLLHVQLLGNRLQRHPLPEHRVDLHPPPVVTSVAEPMREPDVVGGEVTSVHLEYRIVVGRRLPIGTRRSRLEVPTTPEAVALGISQRTSMIWPSRASCQRIPRTPRASSFSTAVSPASAGAAGVPARWTCASSFMLGLSVLEGGDNRGDPGGLRNRQGRENDHAHAATLRRRRERAAAALDGGVGKRLGSSVPSTSSERLCATAGRRSRGAWWVGVSVIACHSTTQRASA